MNLLKDRSWMARRKSSTEIGATTEFRASCQVFLDYAYSNRECVNDKNQIRCPCWKCKNVNYQDRDIVNFHLLVNSFMRNYEEYWWAHGQKRDGGITINNAGSSTYRMNEMVHDFAGPDFNGDQAREQPINADAKDFFKLLDKGSEPLWDGCTKQSKLSAVATLLNIKTDHNMSHEFFESLLKAIKNVMHVENNVFDNLFNTVMNVTGKTKDNDKAREDMKDICKRPTLEIHKSSNGKTVKPQARYTLSKNQVEEVCTWIRSLKLPGGYASNIARLYDGELKSKHLDITDKDIEINRAKGFALWIKDKVTLTVESTIPANVLALAMGPDRDQVSRNGYKVNGYDFHTKAYGLNKRTTNSGVCVQGDCYNELSHAFYGELEEIIELSASRKRDRPPADWQVVIHTPARKRQEVVDGEFFQESILYTPVVINVDDDEIIQLDGGDNVRKLIV
ncbi:hypothetical protein POM88_054231 [Heracleum sosnowskyi]|uniref:Transposase-associated domain-containing protein n=1 Tax=Heracleum sosnowskyi TaxID=360622 RepID=A0AAD8LX79_9APIA|nr:hypothetical protein POM88_054231 [Heracleum sosnowskyi]